MNAELLTAPTETPAPGELPRLLAGAADRPLDLVAHGLRHGRLPDDVDVIDVAEQATLLGRGGASFPLSRKLSLVRAAVSRRGEAAVVVANAAEGEPASAKDRVLLSYVPHLVLDGLQLVAAATGASTAYLYVHADDRVVRVAARALTERSSRRVDPVPVSLVSVAPRFIAGEESAVVHRLAGGDAVPTYTPVLVGERGVGRRPTLVSNVETLAHLALVARYGATWFRELGTATAPGSTLVTLRRGGAPSAVREVAIGAPLASLVALESTEAVLIGGYHGTWVPAAMARRLRLDDAELSSVGASRGAGVLAALPVDRCGVVETARVLRYLALESAGQCGPCLNGLPRIAVAMADLAAGRARPTVVADLSRWAGLVSERGACHHPDGTVRLLASALRTFEAEVDRHLAGGCSRLGAEPFLPTPGLPDRGGVP